MLFQDRQLDWFPRMRAMSLANDDGDSEQNDIRVLQTHLESTNRIVKELSKQLSELKDQVCIKYQCFAHIVHIIVLDFSHDVPMLTARRVTLQGQGCNICDQFADRSERC